ncbi:acetyl-CoA synthetase [Plasticicumulans lactativorans]|uniref:acetate--CoA ligase n=1 Tax=Plasticicumulans lactativorans TaxID=1133106 RepID=A0A4R2L744_9GAMM|nr:acetate--CoA ligase [Plasticicumulans lactativorans]TCO82383.1 acetyl-CoA synthetase [Plasticicumulans lactativorans]
MDYPIIDKPVPAGGWNLADYAAARRDFDWQQACRLLDGRPGGINIGCVATDRHVRAGRGAVAALRWLGKDGTVRELSYGELAAASDRFAAALQAAGIAPGERVAVLAGRIPELYVAALGTLKAGAVFCPLFSAFGPEPVYTRLSRSEARVLVTTATLYARKVQANRARLPALTQVVLAAGEAPDTLGWQAFLDAAREPLRPVSTGAEDAALLHYTSGTTGAPKGALHVHGAVLAHAWSGHAVLDLRPGDVYWCTADPGWVTGMSYGLVAPLVLGATLVVDEAEFDAGRWYDILERERVNVWYTAPTAIRMLMKYGAEPLAGRGFPALRLLASVGEPLNPEAVVWAERHLGRPFHDTWWQTETGAIMVANYGAQAVRLGSMGRPLPGVEVAIVRRRRDGGLDFLADGEEGEIAIRAGWPSMFRGYLDEAERYAACFAEGWYLAGDLAVRDADGYFWFVGRNDDVIKTAGHLIGPFEVENVLMEHAAVAEAGVIGKPDPYAGEVIKAFVALKPGHVADDALRKALIGLARARLGPAVAPRELDFLPELPRTRSGKILRRLLKARELGLPEGDLSTLETDSDSARS